MMSMTKLVLPALAVLLVAASAEAAGDRVYFGNLHSHTSYSDGSGTPEEAYRHARDVAQLDFLAITEHNHSQAEDHATPDRRDKLLIATDRSLYEKLKAAAARFTRAGRFVALYGQEVSSISAGNHMNVFEVDSVLDEKAVPNGRFDLLFKGWLPLHPDSTGQPAVAQLNHPYFRKTDKYYREYGQDDFASHGEWLAHLDGQVRTMEMLNGPAMAREGTHLKPEEFYESHYHKFLGMGVRIAPSADQDNHYRTWGTITEARTAIIAPALEKRALLDALRQRHVYATEDRNLRMQFRVAGELTGRVLDPAPAPREPVEIQWKLEDDDEPDASYTIEVWAGPYVGEATAPGGGKPAPRARRARRGKRAAKAEPAPARTKHRGELVHRYSVGAGEARGNWRKLPGVRYLPGYHYMFFKVIQSDGDRAWSSPVWFGPRPGGSS